MRTWQGPLDYGSEGLKEKNTAKRNRGALDKQGKQLRPLDLTAQNKIGLTN